MEKEENEHGAKSHVVKSIAQCENYLDVTFWVTAGQEKKKQIMLSSQSELSGKNC